MQISKKFVEFIKQNKFKNEIWVEIEEYPNYFISNFGRVISFIRKYHKPKILKPFLSNKGYPQFKASKNKKRKNKLIHRYVGIYFVNGKNKDNNIINHKDGNKKNNIFTNLEWSSFSKNNQHAYDTGLKNKGEKHCAAKLTDKDIKKIKILYYTKLYTNTKIAKMFNISNGYIKMLITNKRRRNI